jgi:hypothetical protein
MNMQILPLSTKYNYQTRTQNCRQKEVNFGAIKLTYKPHELHTDWIQSISRVIRTFEASYQDGVIRFRHPVHEEAAKVIFKKEKVLFTIV